MRAVNPVRNWGLQETTDQPFCAPVADSRKRQKDSFGTGSNVGDHRGRQFKDSCFPAIGRGASLGWRVLLVLRHVQVQESSDHLLVLRVMLASFALEESNALFAQTNRDLDLLFAKSKFGGRGEKIPNDVNLANGTVSVCDFPAHRSFCLSANIRRRRCE